MKNCDALGRYMGSEATIAALRGQINKGKLAHALLLCAPDGCGRNHAARLVAAQWLFPQGGAGATAVLKGESSEVITVQGEGKSGHIPIARIRAIRAEVHLSALSSAGRVVLIRDAHNMAAPAANALLKVLEEPPANVLFVLSSHSPGGLPATVVSRCAVFTLAPLPVQLCSHRLSQYAGEDIDESLLLLLSLVYGGCLGPCIAAIKDPQRLEILQDGLAIASAAAMKSEYEMMRLLAGYEGKAEGERERREALMFDISCALQAALHQRVLPGLAPMPAATAAMILPHVLAARAALAGNAAAKACFAALCANVAML